MTKYTSRQLSAARAALKALKDDNAPATIFEAASMAVRLAEQGEPIPRFIHDMLTQYAQRRRELLWRFTKFHPSLH